MDLEGWSARLKVFADATRVRLLALLEREELTVAELSAITRLAQPRVSTHLAKLKEAGLVRDRRAGVSRLLPLRRGRARRRAARAVADAARRQRRPAAAPGRRARRRRCWPRAPPTRTGPTRSPATWSATIRRAAPGKRWRARRCRCSSRRRARHRLRRRRAGRTAGAARAAATSASTPAHAWSPPPRERLRRLRATSKCARATCTPCPSPTRSFDLVRADARADLCRPSPAQAVAEAARVLRRGGRLLLTQPGQARAPRARSRPTATSTSASREKELRKFADKAGLDVVSCRDRDARTPPAAFRSDRR